MTETTATRWRDPRVTARPAIPERAAESETQRRELRAKKETDLGGGKEKEKEEEEEEEGGGVGGDLAPSIFKSRDLMNAEMHRSASTTRASEEFIIHGSSPSSKGSPGLRSSVDADELLLPMYDPLSDFAKRERQRVKLAERAIHLIPVVGDEFGFDFDYGDGFVRFNHLN
ncbi:hypothetical protein Syun_018576 [Stephania yunnanensis]|uniref:Uncharacterized protein n=1 Tax=Stephania yunnanensis TaxID=152371 RepID=A0AAP0ISI6_9MAGN